MKRIVPFLLLAALALVGQAEAQSTMSARAASLRLGGRLHSQYQASSVDGEVSDFFIRRARLIVDGTFTEFLTGRVQVDFAGGEAALLDAFMRLNFSEGFSVLVGQTKRSFDLFELSSSTDLSIIERDGRINGYSNCSGVGRVCSLSRLTESLGFSGRDMGIVVGGTSGTVTYEASLMNGEGVGAGDDNDGKSLSARSGVAVAENVVVSASLGLHDYVDPLDATAHALAWGGDVQYGTWRDGLLVQAEVVGGENWRSLDLGGNPGQFLAFQMVGSFYHALSGDRIVGIEPLLRVSVADPNGSIDADGGTLVTPGLMFYIMGKNKIGANLDYYMPGTGSSEFGFRFSTLLYF